MKLLINKIKKILYKLGFGNTVNTYFRREKEDPYFSVKGHIIDLRKIDGYKFREYQNICMRRIKLSDLVILNNSKYYGKESPVRDLELIQNIKIIFLNKEEVISDIIEKMFVHYIVRRNGIVELINRLKIYNNDFSSVIIALPLAPKKVWTRKQKESLIRLISMLILRFKLNPWKSLIIEDKVKSIDIDMLRNEAINKIYSVIRKTKLEQEKDNRKQLLDNIAKFKSIFLINLMESYNEDGK